MPMFALPSLLSSLKDPKLVRFAVFGALGCVAGAVLGELLLAATRPPSAAQAVCLLIDCSGSMNQGGEGGQKLQEVKQAALGFVGRHATPQNSIAVIGFGARVHRGSALSSDAAALRQAIQGLFDGRSTAMDLGLQAAADELGHAASGGRPRSILLFTDGMPDDPAAALTAAQTCRQQKLRIVAIGTDDANDDYLAQVTGDPQLVFRASSGTFDAGFKQAERAIYGGSLVESSSRSGSFVGSLLRTAGWTALASLGVSLALVVGQNLYVHRAPLTPREALTAIAGGIGAGLAGGIAGQLPYALVSASANLPAIGPLLAWTVLPLGRIVGWAILGALVGRGLALFIPNLEPKRALLGGTLGGGVGAIGFLAASLLGDVAGALVGAAILGGAIGLMLALVEAAYRQAWLEVRYGLKEVITVSLGANPVRIGSDSRACHVYARGARPLAYQYRWEDGRVVCVDYATEISEVVAPDSEKEIGGVTVIVRAARNAAATGEIGAGAPAQMTIAPPPPPKTVRPSAPPPPGTVSPGSKAPAKSPLAPPPPPVAAGEKTPSDRSSSAPPAASGGPRVIRPVPPPPPPHKKHDG